MEHTKEHIEAKKAVENLRNKTSNNEKMKTYLDFLNPNYFYIGGIYGQEFDLDQILEDIRNVNGK
jgi:hypothetical protein